MNETDLIRQQLQLERTHLREILRALGEAAGSDAPAHPVAVYIGWAGRRLIEQVLAHHTALEDAGTLDPALSGQLHALTRAARQARSRATAALPAAELRALLEAWSEPLEAATARVLRVPHWRRAAQMTADSILEERRLYGAARAAVTRR